MNPPLYHILKQEMDTRNTFPPPGFKIKTDLMIQAQSLSQ